MDGFSSSKKRKRGQQPPSEPSAGDGDERRKSEKKSATHNGCAVNGCRNPIAGCTDLVRLGVCWLHGANQTAEVMEEKKDGRIEEKKQLTRDAEQQRAENEQLYDVKAKLEKDRACLQEENELKDKEIERQRGECKSLKDALNSLKNERDQLQKVVATKDDEIRKLDQKVTAHIKGSETERAEKDKKIGELNNQLSKRMSQGYELTVRLSKALAENEVAKNKNEELSKCLAFTEAKAEGYRKEWNTERRMQRRWVGTSILRKTLVDRESEAEQSKDHQDGIAVEGECKSRKDDTESLKNGFDQLEKDGAAKDDEIRKLDHKLTESNACINRLETACAEKGKEIEELLSERTSLVHKLSTKLTEKADLVAKVESIADDAPLPRDGADIKRITIASPTAHTGPSPSNLGTEGVAAYNVLQETEADGEVSPEEASSDEEPSGASLHQTHKTRNNDGKGCPTNHRISESYKICNNIGRLFAAQNDNFCIKTLTLTCSNDGCTNQAQKGGVCAAHGKKYTCNHEGCTNWAKRGGFCQRHGEKITCSAEGCSNVAFNGDVCVRHREKITYARCSHKGCKFYAKTDQTSLCAYHAAIRFGESVNKV